MDEKVVLAHRQDPGSLDASQSTRDAIQPGFRSSRAEETFYCEKMLHTVPIFRSRSATTRRFLASL